MIVPCALPYAVQTPKPATAVRSPLARIRSRIRALDVCDTEGLCARELESAREVCAALERGDDVPDSVIDETLSDLRAAWCDVADEWE